jgi:transcriptional regulator with XRE-family HTH domain
MKRFRASLGFSQEKLAEKALTATNYIALIETGKRFPTPKMLEQIAIALEVDTPELFSLESAKKLEVDTIHRQILTDIEVVLSKHLGAM